MAQRQALSFDLIATLLAPSGDIGTAVRRGGLRCLFISICPLAKHDLKKVAEFLDKIMRSQQIDYDY
jgi:hypothetical protein